MEELEAVEAIEKYLLLLLYAEGSKNIRGEPVRSNLWLQKELFLISRNIEELREEFEPYLLGPYSEALDEYAEQLAVSKFIEKNSVGIKLTDKGLTLATKLWEDLDEETKRIIRDSKSFLNDMTRDELLVVIYSTFEDSTINSEIREEVEAKRVEVAISLFRKGKISLGRAASISKLSLNEFKKVLRQRNIPIHEYTNQELLEELLGGHPSSS